MNRISQNFFLEKKTIFWGRGWRDVGSLYTIFSNILWRFLAFWSKPGVPQVSYFHLEIDAISFWRNWFFFNDSVVPKWRRFSFLEFIECRKFENHWIKFSRIFIWKPKQFLGGGKGHFKRHFRTFFDKILFFGTIQAFPNIIIFI